MADEVARAFVPGHVTGFFSPAPAPDPERAGSRGAGVALSDGVTVTVESAPETTVELNGDAAEIEPVERVLAELGATARVEAETPLRAGAGFGVSGAMALGTALAANRAFDRGRSENDLMRIAHVAEVRAGTGLGDVVAQARGGVPVRLEPGAPPHGRLDGVPDTARVEYLTMGELSTTAVLTSDTTAIEDAGDRALARLLERPTLDRLMRVAGEFADAAGIVPDEVREVLDGVAAEGGDASMAMLGKSVFAFGTALTDAGYDADACRVHPAGATLRDTDV